LHFSGIRVLEQNILKTVLTTGEKKKKEFESRVDQKVKTCASKTTYIED
jgi:hypothetical protein